MQYLLRRSLKGLSVLWVIGLLLPCALLSQQAKTVNPQTGKLDITADILTSGSNADSTTSESDSGLEIIGKQLSLLRGCADDQVLVWDETEDDWNCETISSGGTPGGSDTQVQFNESSSFGGDAEFTYNTTSKVIDIDGSQELTGPFAVGGTSIGVVQYNIISDSTTSSQTIIDSDDDLYIEGSLDVVGTGYFGTVNASELDGLDSTAFIRSDASDSYTSGTLTFDSTTLLDVDGSADFNSQLSASHVDISGSLALTSKFDVGGTVPDNVSYNIISDSTTSAQAILNSDDDLFIEGNLDVAGTIFGGTVSGLSTDADTLDSLDSLQFLRSDASDSFTSGTLTFGAGTTLDVDASLDINGDIISDFTGTNLSVTGGVLNAAGGGGGSSEELFHFSAASLLDTGGTVPPLTQITELGSTKFVRAYDDTITEESGNSFTLPTDLDTSTSMNFMTWTSAATASATNNIEWTFTFVAINDSGTTASSLVSADLAVSPSQGFVTKHTTLEDVSVLGFSAGDLVNFKLQRSDPSTGELVGDAWLHYLDVGASR